MKTGKRVILLLLTALCLLSLGACGRTRIIHCDSCGKEIEVREDSQYTEDWLILCSECEKASGIK